MSHTFTTGEPHPRLRRALHGYTGYEEHGPPVARLEEPPGRIELIVGLGPEIEVVDRRGRSERHDSFVVGLAEEHSYTRHDGHQLGIQIGIEPPAARMLLCVPLAEIAHRVVGLEDLFGRDAPELVERLNLTSSWTERFRALDAAFTRRLSGSTPPPREVSWAWHRLATSGGAVTVAELADETGWSRRHLSERFRQELGIPPKTAARVLRFHGVARHLRKNATGRLGELAVAAGYFDQAHLNRDFRAFAGCTPTEFAQRRMADLPSVQDTAMAVA
jgi:AraC-like DNA-binding protein